MWETILVAGLQSGVLQASSSEMHYLQSAGYRPSQTVPPVGTYGEAVLWAVQK